MQNKIIQGKKAIEDKIALAKKSVKSISELRSKIKELLTAKTDEVYTAISEPINNSKPTFKEVNYDSDIDKVCDEISLFDIEGLTESEITNKILSILTKHNKSSASLLDMIKIKLYKETLLYSKMILTAQSEQEYRKIKEELTELQTKITLLDSIEQEQEISENTQDDNNLFFLTSDSGNITFLESIRKNIPKEYYSEFKELLIGIKKGRLKGFKKLSHIQYFEVKDFKIRITFQYLGPGNFLIIDAFMKKEDTSTYYKNSLVNRANQYKSKKDYYMENIQKEEFIAQHEGYLAEILTLLEDKNKEEGFTNETKLI